MIDELLKQEVEAYLLANKIGVCIAYGKRTFYNITTTEKITTTKLIDILCNDGIKAIERDIDEVKDNIIVTDRKKTGPTITQLVDFALTDMHISLVVKDNILYYAEDGELLSMPNTVTKVACYLMESGSKSITDNNIGHILKNKMHDVRLDELKQFKNDIQWEQSLVDQSPILAESLMKIVCGEEYLPLYSVIIRHVIWLIKRKYFLYQPTTIKYPMFINFYSKQGNTGKSSFLEKLCDIIPVQLKKNENHLDDLVNDERKMFSLTERLVIICGELGNLDKACISKLKNMIDMLTIDSRILGLNSDNAGPNRATILGTSNRQLKNVLHDGPTPRKWIEIPFHVYGNAYEQEHKSYLPLQHYDYASLWKSVDESKPSPLESCYPAFLTLVAETCGSPEYSAANIFLRDYILNHNNHDNLVELKDITKSYKEMSSGYTLKNNEFVNCLREVGFIQKTFSYGNRWYIPKYTECPLFTKQEVEKITKELE